MKKFRAFIFDMDGTLVHNMHFHKKAWIEFLETRGYAMTEEDWHANNHGTVEQIMQRIFGKEHSEEETILMGEEKEKLYRKSYAIH